MHRPADAVQAGHWNVKGPNFIALHELFDEINEAVEDYVDGIAERAVQLGGVAEGTARIVAKQRSLGRCHSIRRPSEHDDEKQESQAALGIAVQHMADARQDDGEAENEIWIVRLLRSLVYRHIALHSLTDCRIPMSRSRIALKSSGSILISPNSACLKRPYRPRSASANSHTIRAPLGVIRSSLARGLLNISR